MSRFCLSGFQPQFGDIISPIAEGARKIREFELQLEEPEQRGVPSTPGSR